MLSPNLPRGGVEVVSVYRTILCKLVQNVRLDAKVRHIGGLNEAKNQI